MKINLKNNSGFTLVELMVVVAIIGILTAVAIPNFKSYQAKAKTSEAKLALSGIYNAELALMGDFDTYGTCLDTMGISAPSNNYYAIGFQAGFEAEGATDCDAGKTFSYPQTKKSGGRVVDTIRNNIYKASASTFKASAQGIITAGNQAGDATNGTGDDVWSVDHDRKLTQDQKGY